MTESNLSSLGYGLSLINPDYKIVTEFGVWKGSTMSLIRKTLTLDYQVYGFDSFEGMPDHVSVLKKDGGDLFIIDKGDYYIAEKDGKIDTLLKPGVFNVGGNPPNIPNVNWYVGWFDDTLPKFIKDVPVEPVALIHIDCDHYESTKTVFKFMQPYIKPGTILVFDEWQMDALVKTPYHEKLAFEEWIEENNIEFQFIDYVDPTARFPEERKIVKILSI